MNKRSARRIILLAAFPVLLSQLLELLGPHVVVTKQVHRGVPSENAG